MLSQRAIDAKNQNVIGNLPNGQVKTEINVSAFIDKELKIFTKLDKNLMKHQTADHIETIQVISNQEDYKSMQEIISAEAL